MIIQHSFPEDTNDIVRLCLAQYQRTPWPIEMTFPAAQAFLVYRKHGHVRAGLGYRRDEGAIRVLHVWAEDGFAGRRGACALMLCMEKRADDEGVDLVFTARAWNHGLRKAVEQHGCQSSPGEEPDAVVYRRKARSWAVA